MKRIIAIIIIASMVNSCSRNAITGRNQLSLVSESDLQAMAVVQYRQFLSTNPIVSSGNSNAEMVRRVGNRVAAAVKQYYTERGQGAALNNYNWEFNLVDSREANAWAMPGGKVMVYTGILPITQTEAGLSIVLAHEITHAVVGHGKERMSQEMAAQGIGSLGGAALGGNTQAGNVFNSVYGVGAQYGVLLRNSRKQELEADRFGLIFAAAAGYDPRVAVDFWTRMAQVGSGQKPPVWASSHPSDEQRIQQIRDLMPEALKFYKPR